MYLENNAYPPVYTTNPRTLAIRSGSVYTLVLSALQFLQPRVLLKLRAVVSESRSATIAPSSSFSDLLMFCETLTAAASLFLFRPPCFTLQLGLFCLTPVQMHKLIRKSLLIRNRNTKYISLTRMIIIDDDLEGY